jgi:hypothetical protein
MDHIYVSQSTYTWSYQLIQKYRLEQRISSMKHQLRDRKPINKMTSSGIYKLQYKTCNKSYVGQTGGSVEKRHCEYTRYIKTNKKPISSYTLHVLKNRHEYRNPVKKNMQLLRVGSKGKKRTVGSHFTCKFYKNRTYWSMNRGSMNPTHYTPWPTSIFITDFICSHKYTLLAQIIINSNWFYCTAKQRPNNSLTFRRRNFLLNFNTPCI